jgi:hypothetical protein
MFKTQTVDTILSTFNKAVADLEALSNTCVQKMNANSAKAAALHSENVDLQIERDRAVAAATKIKALTN